MLRRIFGPRMDDVIGRRTLQELHNLYFSPNKMRMIKSRRMKWAGHVERIGEKRNAYIVFVGKSEGKRPLGRGGRRIILKRILEK
jgi:hypothetical protein